MMLCRQLMSGFILHPLLSNLHLQTQTGKDMQKLKDSYNIAAQMTEETIARLKGCIELRVLCSTVNEYLNTLDASRGWTASSGEQGVLKWLTLCVLRC